MHHLIVTSDGSHTIFLPELNEHYHSVYGAFQESKHIFIKHGLNSLPGDSVNILEVGFGTGLNALLTALEITESSRTVNYTSIEKYPLEKETIDRLNHGNISGFTGMKIFINLHSAPWNIKVNITENFNIEKIEGDLTKTELNGSYDLVYFDAFGPDKQPEMWSPGIFSKISAVTKTGGVLVTYSAKGQVKRNLMACGFEVTLFPGPPGKRQMIRAIKK